ncbi:MAG: hypothetical protein LBJ00_10215 [Planctomycetaceae bacterium]|jgi:hypothetical protein|nr:hypothetical protein [Planctomycetaceae bacterium]
MKRLFKGEAHRLTGYGINTAKAKKVKKDILKTTFVRLCRLCGKINFRTKPVLFSNFI